MKYLCLLSFIAVLGCRDKPKIKGFDREQWMKGIHTCEDSRMAQGQLILDQHEALLGSGQAKVKALLGPPDEHELYRRSQKFFYYNLTPADTCARISQPLRLGIRFDALDRAKEVMWQEY